MTSINYFYVMIDILVLEELLKMISFLIDDEIEIW